MVLKEGWSSQEGLLLFANFDFSDLSVARLRQVQFMQGHGQVWRLRAQQAELRQQKVGLFLFSLFFFFSLFQPQRHR